MPTADRVVVELQAKTDAYNAGLIKASDTFRTQLASMQASATQAGNAIAIPIGKGAKAIEAISPAATRATGATRQLAAANANLAAQFQDIGVQLAGGASPFIIAAQQIPQITAGTTSLRGAVGGLGVAFTQLLSPVGLASAALIFGVGAVIDYFSEVEEGDDKAEKALKKEAALIQEIADKWGDAVPAIREYANERKRLAEESDLKKAGAIVFEDIVKQSREQVKGLNLDLVELIELLQAAGASDDDIAKVQQAFKSFKVAVDAGKDSTKENQDLLASLSRVYINTGVPAADEFAKKVYEIADAFKDVADKAAQAAAETQKALENQRLADFVSGGGLPGNLGQLSPLYSGGGKFLDQGQIGGFRANQAELDAAGDSLAASFIKKFEGYISNAKFDVNAFRVGFGSDTTTNAAGEIARVTESTITTLADANRDLERRIVEFQNVIRGQIGSDTFASFTEQQQAALTSITYNYGSLPDRIVAAIQGGGGADKVATAIAGLGADNGGINRNRRNDEAAAFGGAGFSVASATPKKTPGQIFEGSVEAVQKRIDLINREIEATTGLTQGTDAYAVAVAKTRIEQELLNKAQEAGYVLKEGDAERIAQLAQNYAQLEVQQRSNKDTQKDLNASMEEFAAFGKDVLGGFIQDLIAGKSASEALSNALSKVADKLLDIALNALFSTGGGIGGGGGGGFFALLAGLFKAKGGPVRKGQPYIVGEKRAELFVPESNGRIVPSVPRVTMPTRGGAGASGGGNLNVTGQFEVVNGSLVPTMLQVAGLVAGQQVKQATKKTPARLAASQARGT